MILVLGLGMTSRLIGSSHSDCMFGPLWAKVECCKSPGHFDCRVTNCSATKILSTSIKCRHPRSTVASLGGVKGEVGFILHSEPTKYSVNAYIFITSFSFWLINWLILMVSTRLGLSYSKTLGNHVFIVRSYL